MEVILMERIEKLGQMGDVVKVKPGFARNFLLPQGKALRATEANKAQFELQRAQLETVNLEKRSEAEAVAAKMTDVSIILVRQAGDAGQLYGSVNARDISDTLTADGYTVDRSQVRQEIPIKNLGLHAVLVSLHPEVSVTITVNVARSADEALIQSETGRALLSQAEEEARADAEALEAEAKADEAIMEQAEAVFDNEGLTPEAAPEPSADDAEAGDETDEVKSDA
ncbi:MAG: 50S ribosomal protein L9 [Rhodospirillales bacterium]|nr:50S ribosomal protein L9 [Rhodospirillales bacterium]